MKIALLMVEDLLILTIKHVFNSPFIWKPRYRALPGDDEDEGSSLGSGTEDNSIIYTPGKECKYLFIFKTLFNK